jgi:hypothetical protein
MSTDEYWSIDIPGLTREQARRIRDFALGDAQLGVILTDPKTMMVRAFDAPTVKLMVRCLYTGLESGSLGHEDEAGARSLVEDCNSWLAQSDAEHHDGPH